MATVEQRPDRVTAADLRDVLAADPTFSGPSAATLDDLAAATERTATDARLGIGIEA